MATVDKKSINETSSSLVLTVIDWYFNDNVHKILFPDNVICGFLNIMFPSLVTHYILMICVL